VVESLVQKSKEKTGAAIITSPTAGRVGEVLFLINFIVTFSKMFMQFMIFSLNKIMHHN